MFLKSDRPVQPVGPGTRVGTGPNTHKKPGVLRTGENQLEPEWTVRSAEPGPIFGHCPAHHLTQNHLLTPLFFLSFFSKRRSAGDRWKGGRERYVSREKWEVKLWWWCVNVIVVSLMKMEGYIKNKKGWYVIKLETVEQQTRNDA